jgi:hypothetical protein
MPKGEHGEIGSLINSDETRVPGHRRFLSRSCHILHPSETVPDHPHIRHAYASTTAIYASVSNDFKNKTLQAALSRVYAPSGKEEQ